MAKGEKISVYLYGNTVEKLELEFPYQWCDTAEKNRSPLINRLIHFAIDKGFAVPKPLMTDLQRLRDDLDCFIKLMLEKGIIEESELRSSVREYLYEKGILKVV